MTLRLLPPAPHLCQVCAVAHDPAEPHNRDTLYYGTRFRIERGRAPTWADAMAHCDEDTRRRWRLALESMGISVDDNSKRARTH